MKKIAILFLFLFFCSGVQAVPQVVCDDETGVCRIVEVPETTADTPAAIVEKTQPSWRGMVGATGVDKFMAFLKGESAKEPETAGFWTMILLALLGGMALNLTPCVLPMLPVNLAIIGASGGKSGFVQGLLYGSAMAVTYGVLGVLAAFVRISFGTLNSSPVFNFVIAFIFVLLALAMAGVFNLDLSSKFRISPSELRMSKQLSALVMGVVAALLAGACVAPVVISVLIFSFRMAQNGAWYGGLMPFALGVGMGLPWPLVGAGWSILPKPGKFMVTVKYIFAALIFAMAGYYTYLGVKLLPDDELTSTMDGVAALAQAEEESRETGKPVLVRFTASWCKNCHEMERTTLREPEVADYIAKNFIYVTFPAEDPSRKDIKAVLEKYAIPGFPAFVIIYPPGN